MKAIVAILLTIVLLSGCVAERAMQVSKAGGTEQEFNSDMRICKYEAMLHPGADDPRLGIFGQAWEANQRKNDLMQACMESKGYQYNNQQTSQLVPQEAGPGPDLSGQGPFPQKTKSSSQ